MIGVVAKMKIKDGKQAEFEAVFRELTASIRSSEPGNKAYQLCRSRSDATQYVVLEMYESDAALDLHKKSDHMRAAAPAFAALFESRPEIEVLDAIP
jgi:quinol monooxygenase YgiN